MVGTSPGPSLDLNGHEGYNLQYYRLKGVSPFLSGYRGLYVSRKILFHNPKLHSDNYHFLDRRMDDLEGKHRTKRFEAPSLGQKSHYPSS